MFGIFVIKSFSIFFIKYSLMISISPSHSHSHSIWVQLDGGQTVLITINMSITLATMR